MKFDIIIFSGPSFPVRVKGKEVLATSPDGGGVILFAAEAEIIVELRFGADKWTEHPKKLQHQLSFIGIPYPCEYGKYIGSTLHIIECKHAKPVYIFHFQLHLVNF